MAKNLSYFKSIWKEDYKEGTNLPEDSNKTQQLIIGLSKFENELSDFTKKSKNDKDAEQLLKSVQEYIELLIDRMTTVGNGKYSLKSTSKKESRDDKSISPNNSQGTISTEEIEVRINSTETHHDEDNKPFTIYVIEFVEKPSNEKKVIKLRYNSFTSLHDELKKKYSQLPSLPGKVIFGSMDKENIEKRRNGLEVYLQKLIKIPNILTSEIFFKYFQFIPFGKTERSLSKADNSKPTQELARVKSKENVSSNNSENQDEFNKKLMQNCADGNLTLVRQLVEKNNANVNFNVSPNGFKWLETPFGLACKSGDEELVEYLIRNGAEYKISDSDGQTPLHIECQGHTVLDEHTAFAFNFDVIKLLIYSGADVNKVDKKGKSSFDYAKQYGIERVFQGVDKKGSRPILQEWKWEKERKTWILNPSENEFLF